MGNLTARKREAYRKDLAVLEDRRAQVEAWQVNTVFIVSSGFAATFDAFDALARSIAGIQVALNACAQQHEHLAALALEVGQPAPDPVADPLAFVERSISDDPRRVALWRALIDGRLAALLEAGES